MMHSPIKTILTSLAAIWLGASMPVSATQTETYGIHAVPAPGKVTIDGKLGDWDLSGQVVMCYDIEALLDIYSAKVAAMYDAEHLYLAIHWTDSTPMSNVHNPRFQSNNGWVGDAVQLRIRTDRISHITAWYDAPNQQPAFLIDYGKDHSTPFGGGQALLFQLDGWKLDQGVETAYLKDPDGKGYVQEMKIPWALIAGKNYGPGEKFQMGVELLWGSGDNVTHRYPDNLQEGSSGREFFFRNFAAWGNVILEPKGHLALPEPAWKKAMTKEQLTGPVDISYQLPKDGKVTLAIDDANGRRVRNLIAAQPRKAGKNVEKWDGLDDNGKPVTPGEYQFKALTHDGIHLKYALAFANPGNPPWPTADNRGAFYGDHTKPQAAASAGDYVALATPMGEAGKHLIGTDLEGQRLWGLSNRVAFDGGHIALATDGKMLWVATEGKQSLIYRVKIADGRYAPWAATQKDSEGREFHPVDLVVSEHPTGKMTGNTISEPNLCAVAVRSGTLAAAFALENAIRFYNAETGALVSSIPVDAPKALAYTPKGELMVLSKGRLLIADGQDATRSFTDRTYEAGYGLAVGGDGAVYLSVRGSDQNVKVFSADGKPLREIGVRGGRPLRGKFIAGGMCEPAGIAIDSRNRLWVAEETDTPKRTSVWDAVSGKLLKDLSGTTTYAGAGALNPFDPTVAFSDDTVYRIDWKNGTYEPTYSLGKTANPNDLFPPSVHRLTSRVIQKNGHTYVYTGGQARGAQEMECTLWDGKDWRSVAHTGVVVQGKDTSGEYAKYQHPFFAGHNQEAYAWADENGDGLVQPEELHFYTVQVDNKPVTLRSFYWGLLPDSDGTITYMGPGGKVLLKFAITGFTKADAPIYDLSKPRVLRPDFPAGVSNSEGQVIGGTEGRIYLNQNPLVMVEADGRVVGGYPNQHISVHGSHTAKASHPGYLIGPSSFLGVIQVGEEKKGGSGELFCLNGNLGENYLFTYDGLFIQSLFKDTRGYAEIPDKAVRGMSLDAISAGSESFGGNFIRTPEGKVYLTNGTTAARVIEVNGLESIHRFNGKFTYTPAQYTAALEQASKKAVEEVAAKAYVVTRGTAAVDGKLTDWPALMDDAQPAIEIQESPTVRYARVLARYDDQNLYLAYRVFAPRSAMKNVGQDERLLFKSGDAVDLMLGPDNAKDGTGCLRLLMTIKDGKTLVAVLNVKKTASPASPAEKFAFSSPWRTITFDRVVTLNSVTLATAPVRGGYIVEAAIPWSDLGVQPKSGLRLKADVGALFSDGGTQTISRKYWSNKATALVSDVPGEADLEYKAWGTFTLE